MPYRLEIQPGMHSEFHRIIQEQASRGIHELTCGMDPPEAIHQVRKRCKKIRAVIRLLRPVLDDVYGEENRWYRDIARIFSDLRDAAVLVETVGRLQEVDTANSAEIALGKLYDALRARREQVLPSEDDLCARMRQAAEKLHVGMERLEDWPRIPDEFKPIGKGLARPYSRAWDAMRTARTTDDPKDIHEWRKRVKYHWYHLRLLGNLWPGVVDAVREKADILGKRLGEVHDLDVLRETMQAEPKVVPQIEIDVIEPVLRRHRTSLLEDSYTLGEKLLAEKPKALRRRLKQYWSVECC